MEDLVIEEEGASSALKITLGDFLIFINWMNHQVICSNTRSSIENWFFPPVLYRRFTLTNSNASGCLPIMISSASRMWIFRLIISTIRAKKIISFAVFILMKKSTLLLPGAITARYSYTIHWQTLFCKSQ